MACDLSVSLGLRTSEVRVSCVWLVGVTASIQLLVQSLDIKRSGSIGLRAIGHGPELVQLNFTDWDQELLDRVRSSAFMVFVPRSRCLCLCMRMLFCIWQRWFLEAERILRERFIVLRLQKHCLSRGAFFVAAAFLNVTASHLHTPICL